MSSRFKKQALRLIWMHNPDHPFVNGAQRVWRKALRTELRKRDNYLRHAQVPKLHVGGGYHQLDGWLNVDLAMLPGTMRMDATHPFPFSNGVFQHVYSEHMIEHISRENGVLMLRECHRVMRPGGVIRIVTPNLASILALGEEGISGLPLAYRSWFFETFIPSGAPHTPAVAIDALFRFWGHQFIYDEATLVGAMSSAGFHGIVRRRLRESDQPELRGLENVGRYPEKFLEYESIALEGTK